MAVSNLLTPAQVAARPQVKERSVAQWLKMGRLRVIEAGGLWRVSPEELSAFLARGGAAPHLSRRDEDEAAIDRARAEPGLVCQPPGGVPSAE